ncbi:Putative neuraminidase (Sialidase) [Sinomonas atrocyanea]|uniref:Putative neuraminidase (Sialidase) n=1 Tax=Sinomonas atrocyanea TaxID=37927 RepID=A0A126ZUD3_9MICC|nr:exo-alpha-sialidase [Sinomonas atrocyanea]AMM30769.1 Putative neuraminidase (Sialidase) [Sinomonas atrocyanea]GEB63815.1 glycosyl hydrolase [Sinomonas atrocyanea]GGG65084.1 glycosyl hydrolase [Sinomonas atrocyanea]
MTSNTIDSAYGVITRDGLLRHADGATFAYLPAPTVQSHAANLQTLPDGRLGCVWFGGTQEGIGDISVWFSALEPGSDHWSEPQQLSDDSTRSEQNPILFTPGGEVVWLLYTAQRAGNQDTAEVRRRISTDSGRTWGPVQTLFPATEAGGVFVRQPPLILPSGRWLVPVFRCLTTPGEKWVGNNDDSAVMVSDDDGRTWREQLVPGSVGCVHMDIQRVADGSLLALYRSRWADSIYASRSTDDGATWSEPEPTELPNNNSSIQFTALADGRLALVYNHRRAEETTERRLSLYDEIDDDGLIDEGAEGAGAPPAEPAPQAAGRSAFWGTPRAPMTLAISEDSGRTWPIRRNLEVGDGYCLSNNSRDGLNREFSYPSVHQGPDGELNIAYTYFRQAIKYVRVSPEWAYGGTTTPGGDTGA